MTAPASTASKGTIEAALRADAIPRAELLRRHPAVVPLVARILGVVPRAFSYLEIWPPAFESYALVVPAFFDIPFCDAGLGIGHELRSLAAYASSRGHGCSYCSAHCAALGSVFKGARLNLQQSAAAVRGGACAIPTPAERAIVEYGLAIARVPSTLNATHRIALQEHFSAKQIEKINLVMTTMGLLNRFMDVTGMVLEGPLLEMARAELAVSGWQEEPVFDPRYDGELVSADESAVELGGFALLRCMAQAVRFESRALSRIPSSRAALDDYLREHLGFVPSYVADVGDTRARRTLAHLLVERLISDHGGLTPRLRAAMCLLAARASDNSLLQAHFEFVGVRVSSKHDFAQLLSGDDTDDSDAAALDFAKAAARVPHEVDARLVERLLAAYSPAAIIELVLTVAIASALQRLSVAKERQLEPEIAAHRAG
jgi:alkylhydroperoxidase family enzyme